MTLKSIIAVEEYFKSNPAPNIPIRLNKATLVTNPAKMIESHISICKNYCGSHLSVYRARPYWERLIQVGKIVKKYYLKKQQNDTR